MGVIEQDGLGLDETVANVLGHASAEYALDLPAVESGTECLDRGDAKLFVDAKDTPRVKARMHAELDQFGCGVRADLLESFEGACFDDLANGAADCVADASVDAQIGVTADQLVDALA